MHGFYHKVSLIFLWLLLAGCATPYEVAPVQAGDERLSCQDLKSAMREAGTFKQLADHEQGLTGTNVSSFLFWWPGLVATYINTTDAKDAADERTRHLTALYTSHNCDQQLQAVGAPSGWRPDSGAVPSMGL